MLLSTRDAAIENSMPHTLWLDGYSDWSGLCHVAREKVESAYSQEKQVRVAGWAKTTGVFMAWPLEKRHVLF